MCVSASEENDKTQLSFFLKSNFIVFASLGVSWVFAAARGLFFSRGEQVCSGGGAWASRCPPCLLVWRGRDCRCTGFSSRGAQTSCSAARGIFPDQGWNPRLPHWQVDSPPLSLRGARSRHSCLQLPWALGPGSPSLPLLPLLSASPTVPEWAGAASPSPGSGLV